jgi:hypothetical protein
MATWYLLNTVTLGAATPAMPPVGPNTKFLPGHLIDDTQIASSVITAAGGILWPSADTTVAAAALVAQKFHNQRADNEAKLESIMLTAALASLRTGSGGIGSIMQKVTMDVPLATLKAKTSTTAFNIGSPLPANARLFAVDINVIQALTGTGPLTAATATVQNTGETAGALIASQDIFTATGVFSPAGSNPDFTSRGGQQLQMTVTTTGGTMAALTAGHVAVDAYYIQIP